MDSIKLNGLYDYYYDTEKGQNDSRAIVRVIGILPDDRNIAKVSFVKVINDNTGNDFFTYLQETGCTMNVSIKYLHEINNTDELAKIMKLEQKEMPIGWLSPKGDFYPVKNRYRHFDEARRILKNNWVNNPDDKLLDSGYVETIKSKFPPFETSVFWKKFLTEEQKNFLTPYFENGLTTFDSITDNRWKNENSALN